MKKSEAAFFSELLVEKNAESFPFPTVSLETFVATEKAWVYCPSFLAVKTATRLANRNALLGVISQHADVLKLAESVGWESLSFNIKEVVEPLLQSRSAKTFFPRLSRFLLAPLERRNKVKALIQKINSKSIVFPTAAYDLGGLTVLAKLQQSGSRLYFSSEFRPTEKVELLKPTLKMRGKQIFYFYAYGAFPHYVSIEGFHATALGSHFFKRNKVHILLGAGGSQAPEKPKSYRYQSDFKFLFLGDGSAETVANCCDLEDYAGVLQFIEKKIGSSVAYKEHPGASIEFLGLPLGERRLLKHLPAEWLDLQGKIVLGVTSPVMAYFAKTQGVKTLCLAHLVRWSNQDLKTKILSFLKRESEGKILFPHTWNEVENLIQN
jgi:hypothetical protein